MKKTFFLLFLHLLFLVPQSFGQKAAGTSVYLTGYTFPAEGGAVCYVRTRQGAAIKSVRIGGKGAAAFRLGKDRQLFVKKGGLGPAARWADVVLTVTTADGTVTDSFRIVKNGFIRNKVIAHRGAWKNTGAAENSLAALDHALALGCEGSEFDVHMSSDSVLFIHHDPDVEGVSIAGSPADRLSALKLSNGEPLPTLESYLKGGISQNRTKLILEIKPSTAGKESSLARTRKVVELVEALHAQAWVDYISFDYDVCREVMKRAPYAKVAYLMGDKAPAVLVQDRFYGLDYHFSVLQKNPGWIPDARQKGLTVNVWTVNDQKIMEGLLRENVDFITTNEPELLLQLVSGK